MKSIHEMNILLVAEEAAGVQSLRRILNSGHTLVGVLTTDSLDDDTSGKNRDELLSLRRNKMNSSIVSTSKGFGILTEDARQVTNPGFSKWIKSNQIDVLLNVHSLHRICPEVIDAVRVGAFNLHPGLLPAYSGLNIPSWAVYNEESTHAVTIHRIAKRVDAGDIVYEKQFPLTSVDTGLSVSIKCVQNGMELIESLLTELGRDPFSLPYRPQDLRLRTLYKRNDIPGDGFIQWSEPAHKINAFIRACNFSPFVSPWGEPKTIWADNELSILNTKVSSHVCHEDPGTVGRIIDGKTSIASADFWLLVDRCKLSGKAVLASSCLKEGDKLTSAC